MLYLATKALVSGVIVMVVSELARRSPALGALVVSLPLVSILAIIWLHHETYDTARVADQAQATFWYVLPSLAICVGLTALLYFGMTFGLARFGITL